MTTTDTTTDTDSTTDTTTVEPQPAVTDETTTVDTETTDTSEASAGDDSEVDEDQDDAGDGPGREAAKYRRRLRDAETERDRLSERVVSLQRAEVERLATADSLRPAALWSSGVELADLLSDDGTVSAAKVSEAIGAAREQLGIPNPPPRNYVKNEGRNPGRPAGKPSGREAMVGVVMGHDSDDR
jgi:hypothetical protein